MNERDPTESPRHAASKRRCLRIPMVLFVVAAIAGAAETSDEPLIEDEIKVIGERMPMTVEDRMRIYRELAKARQLYSNNEIDEAFPLLLNTARKGFKNAQARVGHIYLRGLGSVEQDPVEALGWLG
ncbi:MAG: SEL1-like repeat protein, partial [Gammaproteobacteria bacterium]|nr:SEL1-like repeat protein [Gammaproteobacteria bacterium]